MALVYAVPLCYSSLAWSIAALLLFRLYDIAKPFPINRINDRTDPFSVMFDDVLAGVYTIISVYAFQFGLNVLIPIVGSF